jgi:hypothetical protein
MVEPGIEPGTSWLVVRSSDHQTMRLVRLPSCMRMFAVRSFKGSTSDAYDCLVVEGGRKRLYEERNAKASN